MIEETSASSPRTRAEEAAAWAGLLLVLAPLLIRAMSPLANLPYWDLDPLTVPASHLGLGPAGSMTVDACVMFGAGLLMIGTARLPRAGWLLAAAIVLAPPLVLIVYHGWLSPGASLGQQRIGAAWGAAGLAALAVGRAGQDPRLRAVALAAILGAVVAMSVKGAGQVLIENRQTIADFKVDRAKIFAAQGWSPDSPQARSYERRLTQNVATTWLGLSNVYATFAAAAAAGFATLLWASFTTAASKWTTAAAAFGFGLCSLGVILTQSKGGLLALALGLFIVAIAWWLRRTEIELSGRWLLGIGPLLVAGAWGLVVVRGLLGDRLGELSLLFRWFYAQAAVRIGFAHPLVGVGPDGFREAYLLAKNPLSPEDVASPHLVVLDWWACLGVAGLGLAGLLLWRAAITSRALTEPAGLIPASATRPMIRAVAVIAALVTLGCLMLEQAGLTPIAGLIRVGGMAIWILTSVGALLVIQSDRRGRWGVGAAALALVAAVHAQIDVAGSWTQAVGLWAVCVAVGAAGTPPLDAKRRRRGGVGSMLGLACVALSASFVVMVLPGVWRWESSLARASAVVRPVAEVRSLLAGDGRGRESAQQRWEQAAIVLSTELRRPIAPQDAARAAQELQQSRARVAFDILCVSAGPNLRDFATAREASQLAMSLAVEARRAGDPAGAELWRGRAREAVSEPDGVPPPPPRAARLSWLATLHEAWFFETGRPEDARAALELLERSLEQSPYSLSIGWRALSAAIRLEDRTKVLNLAARVATLDDQTGYDRAAVGLSDRQRAWVNGLLNVPEGSAWPAAPGP